MAVLVRLVVILSVCVTCFYIRLRVEEVTVVVVSSFQSVWEDTSASNKKMR